MSEQEKAVVSGSVANPATKVDNAITLQEALVILWKKKWTLALFVVAAAIIGGAYAMWVRPQYSSDVLLQVNVKGASSKSTKAMGEMGEVLELASPADAEIELIKSRMVLSSVAAEEHLHLKAIPTGFWNRLTHQEGRMDLDSLWIPEKFRIEKWTAVVEGEDGDAYSVIEPEGKTILKNAKPGELYNVKYADDSLVIRVNFMLAKEGQKFILVQGSPLKAGRVLMGALNVMERGKKTGIIAVRYSHRYPDRAASILNTIAKTYLRQNIEMRTSEAEKTLGFLESQLPSVKAKLDSAERVLADYRYKIGSIDMNGETRAHISKENDLQRQILDLEQKKQEAMRLFKAEHPSVVTLVKRQNKLRSELAQLKKSAEKMPLTQQEVQRLQEEVAVNSEIYTTMLNNIQQLRVVRVGEVGNVRIVDFAQVEANPSKPKRLNIMICSVAAGLMLGVFFVFMMYMMRNGVRSASEIERETGMNVLVKVPYSKDKLLRKKKLLSHGKPFVLQRTDDEVTESFESMMTAVKFSLTQPMEHLVILVMGLVSGVGKSFVSQNLAATMAANGKKVLLIDADMRRGVHHENSKFGLADILIGKATLDDVAQSKFDDNLYVVGSGRTNMNTCGLLRSEAMDKLLKEARQKFDMVIVDTPPLNLVTDAELICPLVDFSLFVLRYGCHRMDDIKETLSKVARYSKKPGAVVMNQCEYEPGHYGYYEKEYYYKQPQDYKRFSFASLFFLLGSKFGGKQ